jgi:hypothetical protein
MLGKEHMMRSIGCCVALFAAVCVVAAGSGAADGGPFPGAVVGGDGVTAPNGLVRYVALPESASRTTVAAVSVKGGRVTLFTSVPGVLGVPQVAFDGSMGGVSADGRRLVLASTLGAGGVQTTFAVLTRTLRVVKTIRLRGVWSFDAISPDGATIYAIEYRMSANPPSYRVRAVDAVSGRVRAGAIVDKRAPGEVMRGSPVTRVEAAGSAYTLYARPNGTVFVHALDTRHGAAACIDLPWDATTNGIWNVRLSVASGILRLRQRGVGTLASVELDGLRVWSYRPPAEV